MVPHSSSSSGGGVSLVNDGAYVGVIVVVCPGVLQTSCSLMFHDSSGHM